MNLKCSFNFRTAAAGKWEAPRVEVTTVPSLKIGSSSLAKVKLYICRNFIYGNVCVYVCVSSVNKIGFSLPSVCNLSTVSSHPSPSSLPRVQHSLECPCPEQNVQRHVSCWKKAIFPSMTPDLLRFQLFSLYFTPSLHIMAVH